MANVHNNLSELFTDIADAIRSKTGSTDPIVADEFPIAIEAIEASGSSEETWFNDGNTHIWISLTEERKSPMLGLGVKGTVTVDWGDGSAPDTLTGTAVNTETHTPTHEYGKAGDYVITLSGDGQIGINKRLFVCNTDVNDYANWVYKNAVEKIEVGNSVGYIYNLREYASLKSVNAPDTVKMVSSSALKDCRSLRDFNISGGITSLPAAIFENCYALVNVNIPNGVTSIGDSVFNNCRSIGSVNIPNSVTSIGSKAFYFCCGVAYFDFSQHTTVPSLSAANAFESIPSDCQIRVPAALVDEWKAATNWSTYADYIVGV